MELQKKEIIKNYLLDENLPIEERKERFEIAWDVWENVEEIKKEMRREILIALVDKIKNSQEFSGYEVKDGGLLDGQKWKALRIYKSNWFLSEIGIPLCYAIEAGKFNYFDLYLGIVKWNDEKGIPFKGNWWCIRELPSKWREILSKIFENLEKLSEGWEISDWWIAWKHFDSYYAGMWQKEFYLQIIKEGYEAVAKHYFEELLKLKEATEDLLDDFIEEYKKSLSC